MSPQAVIISFAAIGAMALIIIIELLFDKKS